MKPALVLLLFATVANAADRYPRVLFFHSNSCPPCHSALYGPSSFPPWLGSAGWQIDGSTRAHVQLVDVDRRHDLATIHGVEQIPAMVLLSGPGQSSRPVTYSGRASLVGMFR